MKPLAFPLLTDENIHPDVIAGLRARGKDVRTVADARTRTAASLLGDVIEVGWTTIVIGQLSS